MEVEAWEEVWGKVLVEVVTGAEALAKVDVEDKKGTRNSRFLNRLEF